MINFMVEHWDEVLLAITSTVTAASVVVKFTPNKKDDEIVARILNFLKTIAFNKEKK